MYTYYDLYILSTRAHTHRELIRECGGLARAGLSADAWSREISRIRGRGRTPRVVTLECEQSEVDVPDMYIYIYMCVCIYR